MIPQTDHSEYDLNRLRWHCRRGMLELDYLLLEFVDDQFGELSDSMKTDFVRLLDQADQDLHRWLVKGEPIPDQALQNLVDHLFMNRASG